MTDTSVAGNTNAALTAMKLPQLQALASELGVAGVAKMKKSDLVAAISNGGVAPARSERTSRPAETADIDSDKSVSDDTSNNDQSAKNSSTSSREDAPDAREASSPDQRRWRRRARDRRVCGRARTARQGSSGDRREPASRPKTTASVRAATIAVVAATATRVATTGAEAAATATKVPANVASLAMIGDSPATTPQATAGTRAATTTRTTTPTRTTTIVRVAGAVDAVAVAAGAATPSRVATPSPRSPMTRTMFGTTRN